MDLNLGGRTALVTGGSQGIGRAIATELAGEGVAVAINARDADRLMAAADDIAADTGGRVAGFPGDMAKADDIEAVAAAAVKQLGPIDILINNAGSAPAGLLEQMPDQAWHDAIELKLMGYMRMARILVSDMRARKWGRVINIVGRLGHQPRGDNIIGSPVNAAVQNFTVALAAECAPDNVLVNAINPGPIRTPRHIQLTQQRAKARGISEDEAEKRALASVPVGRFGEPEDIAGIAAFLCSERAGFIAGAMINVDGGGTHRV